VAKKDEAEAKEQKQAVTEGKTEKKAEKKAESESSSGFDVAVFLKGTREELDKVVWPSRQQLVSESFAVILMVTLSATVIYLIDQLFSWAAKQVF